MKHLVLCIDIGGSHIKASVADPRGRLVGPVVRHDTPARASPQHVLGVIGALEKDLPRYDRISAGFPGVVRSGRIITAPNLGTKAWRGFDLAGHLTRMLGKPARILNDAEVQGLGVISGKGLELVITLGTGFGSALYRDGEIMPHMELGQHPMWHDETYDQYLGHAALLAKGPKKWNRRLERALGFIATLLDYDRLYIGGGNVKTVSLRLPKNVKRVANEAGITGGARLWDAVHDRLFDAGKQRKTSQRR